MTATKSINDIIQENITKAIDKVCDLIATNAEMRKVFAQAVSERSHGKVLILTMDELEAMRSEAKANCK